jgi:hypothetical protein
MKKLICLVMFFAYIANVSAQLEVDATGNTHVAGKLYLESDSGIIATTGNVPITFKVNGILAGSTGRSGKSNVSFGYNALSKATSGSNTAIGYWALYANTTGSSNTAIGDNALTSNTTGQYNIAIGVDVLYSNSSGSGNTAIGSLALCDNGSGSYNTASGYEALLSNATGMYNTANGVKALSYNTTGSYNTANGSYALYYNTTGSYNTAIGYYALHKNTTGNYNTANGYYALYTNTTGRYNTASGYYALYANTTGYYNTAIGRSALYTNTTGSNNTAIGYYADVSSGNLSNATAIGYEALATASDQVRIGNSDVTSIGGYKAWSNISDKRTKKNIRTDVPGLAFINGLQPVTYNLDLDAIDGLLKIDRTKREGEKELSQELKDVKKKAREAKEKQIQTGFIAQDVEKTAQSIGYDFSGVDVDEAGIYGLRYAEFVVPLVKAVQELSAQVNEFSEQNDRLQAQIDELLEKDALRSASVAESAAGLQDLTNSGASLQQNIPNPFSQTTQIKCYLPPSITSATLNIYNLQGKQLKQIVVAQRGESSLLIAGSEFEPGIYLYALIADGREVDVKRMILTE